MNIDERLEALTQSVELLAGMHKETERLHKQNETLMGEMMNAIARLAHIAEIHDGRLDDHQERIDNLEGR